MTGAGLAAFGIAVFTALSLWMVARAIRWRARMPFREALFLAAPVACLGALTAVSAAAPLGPSLLGAGIDLAQLCVFAAVGLEAARSLGREPLRGRSGLGVGVLVGLNFAAWTALVFRIGGVDPVVAGHDTATSPTVVGVLLRAALAEELLYRLGIQWHLGRVLSRWPRGPDAALLTTAALWTGVHLGTLEPTWVRALQLFPMGVALGMLSRRFGLASCVAAHLVFNGSTLVPGLVPSPPG
ncbi:MAG: CPBP family intramembrane metalloprotease [Myxococcota bacterium]|nr:CPBP family intramembrane metalloprotease [Myxococcota bacterium]